jgi:hypothetical protein
MKIKGSEILISLMIIVFIGFILFFAASHFAKKSKHSVDEKVQSSDQPVAKKNSEKQKRQKILKIPKPQNTNIQETFQNNTPVKTLAQNKNISKESSKKSNATTPSSVSKTPPSVSKTQPSSMSKTPPSVRKNIKKDRVIKYENVRDNNNHPDHSLMNKRKETFGINESLDLIVKTDEKVQVGENVAPIKKISDRLQLDLGRIVEDNLQEPSHQPEKTISKQNNADIKSHLKQKDRNNSVNQVKDNQEQKLLSQKKSIPIEFSKPKNIQKSQKISVPGDPNFDESTFKIKKMIKAISKKQVGKLKAPTTEDLLSETQLDRSPKPYETSTYLGIRVVQPGANIWEIHFNLLREYFSHKGVTLSPHADEPRKNGKSSGIGKILKFSEQLVNIYNLETQTFEHNLNVIQPLTIIVIYNMSHIFGILDDIDYSVIDRIEFDGESLWIPSLR